jgi:phosphoenolpyruvate---glycerone phosphotransferase subunit DhaL
MGCSGEHPGAALGGIIGMSHSTTTNTLSSRQVLRWLEHLAEVLDKEKDRLTQLDSDIGDGDHGMNMARGFAAVRTALPDLASKDIGAIFKATAMTLISKVGGASGPLYGTFFLQAAAPVNGKMELSHAELSDSFEVGLKGVMKRGGAAVGDKTMIDALAPAIEGLRPSGENSLGAALSRAVEAARKGAQSTVPLVAKKGRASYLGERSAGHLDPGAASSVLLLETLAQTVETQE